jgi:hypothetical protein
LAIALTVIRGLPVLFDAMPYIRHGGKPAVPTPTSDPER